jgi:hypothetical protein
MVYRAGEENLILIYHILYHCVCQIFFFREIESGEEASGFYILRREKSKGRKREMSL